MPMEQAWHANLVRDDSKRNENMHEKLFGQLVESKQQQFSSIGHNLESCLKHL